MKQEQVALLVAVSMEMAMAFQIAHQSSIAFRKSTTPAFVSIGIGPEETKEDDKELVAGVDYEIPNHEDFRTSRRSKLDEQCDAWFGALLGDEQGCLGDVAAQVKTLLTTPVPLVNEEEKPEDDPEFTPYVTTKLPWTPLVPAYGLEEFGLPVPRRNAETWRHFDVAGMIEQDYSIQSKDALHLSPEQVEQYRKSIVAAGTWLEDDECEARLVYVDGKFCSELSKTTEWARNLASVDEVSGDDETISYLSRLTDGFTDELATPVPCNDETLTSYAKLSKPNHNLGDATSQFAINTQQGTACFAALNTVRTQAVAYVKAPENHNGGLGDDFAPKPVLILNALSKSGGVADQLEDEKGAAVHPRTLVVAGDASRLSVVQSCIDLEGASSVSNPTLYNGYTQMFVHGTANVTHSYLEESGGIVTAGVEKGDDEFPEDEPTAREIEAGRAETRNTHLETMDVHVMGEGGAYQGTVMSLGGSGRIRLALSVSLLQTGSHAAVNGFSLSGGTQRADVKTNIHHVAQGTTSEQIQKNMIGGRATGAFRGRIRVEQSAQQTDSQQLSRTILLSDKSRAWAVPSLEIIADDVQCTHGATVSDLSEEELFYLRSRGLDRATARNMLMYAFADDITQCVDQAVLGEVDGNQGLQKRIIRRLENLVPTGERAIKGEFQSV